MAGRTAVGLDIGTSCVRAAELTLGRRPMTLQKFGQVALPVGAMRDGEVADVEAVADAIRHLWVSAKFSTKKVVVGVANQRVVVRQVEVPWLPAKELRAALPFQVQDYVPMPLDQAILDFHPLEEYVDEDGNRKLRLLLIAASRDMLRETLAAVQAAGLRPVSVDLTPFAVLRSLAKVDDLGLSTEGAEALVDIGASVTNIVVHQGGVPRFVRILLLGGAAITEAIAEGLGVPWEEAEGLKQAGGMSDSPAEAPGDTQARVIESSGADFIEQVRSSLNYYQSQPNAVQVDRMALSGGGAQLRGLDARLSQVCRMPVTIGSAIALLKMGNLGLAPEQLQHVEALSAVPVGLAMGRAS